MTREKAVEILKQFVNHWNLYINNDVPHFDNEQAKEDIEAFEMAIRSLEAWDNVLDEIEKAPMPKDRMSFFADGTDVATIIIKKYLKEVKE